MQKFLRKKKKKQKRKENWKRKQMEKSTLETSGELEKTTLQTSEELEKTTLEKSGELEKAGENQLENVSSDEESVVEVFEEAEEKFTLETSGELEKISPKYSQEIPQRNPHSEENPKPFPLETSVVFQKINRFSRSFLKAPVHFLCAIDSRLMLDPWRTPDPGGYTFELSTLKKFQRACGSVCPLTGEALRLAQCEPEVRLREEIREWLIDRLKIQ